ncbi:GAF domain-containing protein [Tepidanaerobacter acetatoxydans]|uniref:GAF domain-containing protein n=1 Tax=Tepidanaerobacter acetatoxydans TaxID=499229 RepID=UPI0009D79864|nr:GAF domain-containing protein [Tepidanaerobacter acetatoxydans]
MHASSYNLTETDLIKKTFRVGEGIVGSVAKQGKAILLQDAEKDRRYVICVHGTKSQMTMPLKAGSEVLGVILLGSYEVEKFKNKDIILLNNIAGEIGLAINNVWLTRKLKEEKESVVILYETAKQLAESIDLDDVAEIGVKRCQLSYNRC